MQKRIGQRRKLLNEREARLLHAVLDVSEPPDPFSDEPAREATLPDLEPTLSSLYGGKTPRTMIRELTRLSDLGFLEFKRKAPAEDWRVLINFEAIRRY
jgi:hypothetical protein